MKYLNTILFAAILFLTSCEKIFLEENLESTDPYKNFDYLWNQCDKKYSYFDLKKVNWLDVKTKYRAKLREGMNREELFNVLKDMLGELKDGHTNLFLDFDIASFDIELLGQDNFDWRILKDNYLPKGIISTGKFKHNFISNNEIGYIRYPTYIGDVTSAHLDFILTRYKNTKGLVLDLRENTGGSVSNVFQIVSRFIDSETLLSYTRIKNGTGHNQFTDPEGVYAYPAGIRYTNKKVAILTDRLTYSSGSLSALMSKGIKNLILIGDTTGGGLGAPNGGQLPNGWTYSFSVSQALTLNKKPDYEKGVPPDILALFDWTDLKKDEVLERAILELKK